MADFSTAPTEQGGNFELIPDGTLAKGFLQVEAYNLDHGVIVVPRKPGKKSDYLKCKIVVTEGPYKGKWIYDNIMRGPDEKSMNWGNAKIRAILEYNGAGPHNPAGYRVGDGLPEGQEFRSWVTDGIPVGVKIGFEKGDNGYKDKNTIVSYLSPNPEGDTQKDFARLIKGDTAPAANSAPVTTPAPTAWSAPAKPAAPAAQPQPAQNTDSPPANAGWGGAGQPAAQPSAAAPNTRPAWTMK